MTSVLEMAEYDSPSDRQAEGRDDLCAKPEGAPLCVSLARRD